MIETNKNVIGQYDMLSALNGYLPEDIPFKSLTHINYSYFMTDVYGNLTPSNSVANDICLNGPDGDVLRSLPQLASDNNVELILNISSVLDSTFSLAISTRSRRRNILNKVENLIIQNHFKGVNIYFKSPSETDVDNYVLFVNEMYDRLEQFEIHKTLSLSLKRNENIDIRRLESYDWLNIICYDMIDESYSIAYHNSPLRNYTDYKRNSVISTLGFWRRKGVDSNDIYIAVNTHGYKFSDCSGPKSTFSALNGIIGYREIKEGIEGNILNRYFDERCKVPYAINTNTNEYITYDDEESLKEKTDICKEMFCKGIMIDSLGYDVINGQQVLTDFIANEMYTAETPLLTKIEDKICDLVEGMSVSEGYLLNWGTCNLEDRALEDLSVYDCYGVVYFEGEDNLEDKSDNFADKYANKVKYRLEVRVPMTEETSNPKYDGRNFAQKAISDIKKLLADNETLDTDYVHKVMYKDSNVTESNTINENADRFTPIHIDISFDVYYNQSRNYPFNSSTT